MPAPAGMAAQRVLYVAFDEPANPTLPTDPAYRRAPVDLGAESAAVVAQYAKRIADEAKALPFPAYVDDSILHPGK